MAVQERYPDCRGCEAPCCRRQFMEDEDTFYTLKDIRAIYRPVGIDVRVVGWAQHPEGRQPMIECNAFDTEKLQCGAYEVRPEHCREYDCRDELADDWRARPHCDIERHRRATADASAK